MDSQMEPILNLLSALLGMLMVAGIIGIVVDRRYKKAGGVRSTWKHRLYFGLGGSFCIVLLVGCGMLGAEPELIGRMAFNLCVLGLAAWELWRWTIRRKHPVNRLDPKLVTR